MSRRDVVVPSGHESVYEQWHLAPAVRVGDTLLCSGVIGTAADGSVPEDLAAQIEVAFDNLEVVLAAAGMDLSDVVELVTFHLDLAEVPVFMAVRDRRLHEPWPAWTAIGVSGVGGGLPGVRLEMKATAAR